MLTLIDASCVICRNGFASAKMVREPDGLPVNAVNGVSAMLWRMANAAPPLDHVAMVFDCGRADNFRREIYPDYKAQRQPLPDWLAPQFDLTRQACDAFGIARVEDQKHEADDVIATYANLGITAGHEVKIVTSDKDLMQLVNDHASISILHPADWKKYDEAMVKAKYGIEPHQVADWLALMGDSSDNIPGVPGIGEKTAAKLLARHHTLEAVLHAAAEGDEMIKHANRVSLIENAFFARKSKQLTELRFVDIEDDDPLAKLRYQGFDRDQIVTFLLGLGLSTLSDQIAAGALDAA